MSFNAQGEWVETGGGDEEVHPWCPGCAPDGVVEPWVVYYCTAHCPSTSGALDHVVDSSYFLSGSAEAGGEGNAQICRLIHPA